MCTSRVAREARAVALGRTHTETSVVSSFGPGNITGFGFSGRSARLDARRPPIADSQTSKPWRERPFADPRAGSGDAHRAGSLTPWFGPWPILSRILVGGRTRRLISTITHRIFMTFSDGARHCDIHLARSMAVRSVAAASTGGPTSNMQGWPLLWPSCSVRRVRAVSDRRRRQGCRGASVLVSSGDANQRGEEVLVGKRDESRRGQSAAPAHLEALPTAPTR